MKHIFLLSFLFLSCLAIGQDTIVKKNGDVIKARITEIGTEEIKFKIYTEQNDGPLMIMNRSEVRTVKVAGQTIINEKEQPPAVAVEDVIVKKTGETFKVKVIDIGTEEVKFKLYNDPDGPSISMKRSEIKTMKVQGQTVIEAKTGITEDVIMKKDGSVIKAKISEVGSEVVRYKPYNNPDGPVLTVKKTEVQSIKIDGQVVYEYKEDPLSVSNTKIIDQTRTVKFYFFSPLYQHVAFGYEWMNRPGFNWDVALGIIGPGVRNNGTKDPRGVFMRGGPKFLLGSSSDVVTEDTKDRYAHPLKGRYIKVEVIFNSFRTINKFDTNNFYYSNGSPSGYITYKKTYQSLSFNLQYGRQFILGNAMTAAWYFGVGYSFEGRTSTLPLQYQQYDILDIGRYSHTYFGRNFPMIFTWGLTVGYILPAPKYKDGKSPTYRNKPPSRHSMDN